MKNILLQLGGKKRGEAATDCGSGLDWSVNMSVRPEISGGANFNSFTDYLLSKRSGGGSRIIFIVQQNPEKSIIANIHEGSTLFPCPGASSEIYWHSTFYVG